MDNTRFTAKNALLVLIDYQEGTISWVNSASPSELKRNVILLARAAEILGLPVILTTSMEHFTQGPLLAELQSLLPGAFEARIKRHGLVDAMEDESFAKAVHDFERSRVILAGVTNDICTVFPALSLAHQGFNVQVVADAGGSATQAADNIALRRMERAGITLTSSYQLIAELAGNWSSPEGGQLAEVLMDAMQAWNKTDP